ncbi:PREDICTED: kynureninase-like [Priapulus caudatus]|uniref:Kynureninase n=1 Tax=Priapulus caudatus TaxID=37621 RepID=A0ABM1DSN0_PRICU|nr:PREDICTED: kynureninase-like [Priapulus caudatus]
MDSIIRYIGPNKRAKLIDSHPAELIAAKAKLFECKITDEELSTRLDEEDPLGHFREKFHIPKMRDLPFTDPELISPDDDAVYLCGNSLGLQPKTTRMFVEKELNKWSKWGVHGHEHVMHEDGDLPWAHCDEALYALSSTIVGANSSEIGIMNSLSVNIHFLLYIIESQLNHRGYNTSEAMICIKPREGETMLHTKDILDRINEEGDSVAIIMFSGVQYYTGQLFDMESITKAGQKKGCIVAFDLAHAVGNVPLHLHDWGVDFASWCTYKYLNSGAGCIAGVFIHEKHHHAVKPTLTGWWGHEHATRFNMDNKMVSSPGPDGFRVSNPSGVLCACLHASLEVFSMTSMEAIREKSLLLTAYLELLLKRLLPYPPRANGDSCVRILTPSDPMQRGAQLSIWLSIPVQSVKVELEKRAVVCDERKPNVLRVSPVVLYNSFHDVYKFVHLLKDAMTVVKF